MGFFRVKAGPDKAIIVTRDCGVKVVLDFLKERLSITDKEVELDLCDEWGNMRFLTQAPLRCSCLLLVASRALYTPVVIRQTPALKFEFPMGRPVLAQKTREAQRKVRRQWDKYQRLRSAAGGQLATDEEAAEIIYQVVGSPSADFGKGKSKGHDPAPRPARQRSMSVGRKKRASVAAHSSEEKENELGNGVKQAEKTSATAAKAKRAGSIVDEQSRGGNTETENVKSEWKSSSTDTRAKEVIETKHKQPKAGSLSNSGQREESKDKITDSSIKKPNSLMDDKDLKGLSKTPSGKTAANQLSGTGNNDKTVDKLTDTPKINMSAKDSEARSLPGERAIHESTDSGIESAAGRSNRRLKDNEMRDLSSDRQSISVEAGSNEESTGESVLSRSETRLKHRRSLIIQAIAEQDDASKIENISTVAHTRMHTHRGSSSLPSDASNMHDERKISAGEVRLDGRNIGDISNSVQADVPHTVTEMSDGENAAKIRNRPASTASGAPQKLSTITSGSDIPMEDIAGVTVSIMPPILAAPHRRSINVTALLGIPVADKAAELGADQTTGKGVPSVIDEQWRRELTAQQLMGVLSGTSKLVYLGSAKDSSATGRRIDVINTTEEEAERLGAQTASLAADGPVENSAPAEAVGEEQEDTPVSQRLDGPDPWKSPSSVVGT